MYPQAKVEIKVTWGSLLQRQHNLCLISRVTVSGAIAWKSVFWLSAHKYHTTTSEFKRDAFKSGEVHSWSDSSVTNTVIESISCPNVPQGCPGDSGKESACHCQLHETWVWCLGWEDPLEKEMATHSNILAWKFSWTEEPHRLQSMGSPRVGHDWARTHTQSHNRIMLCLNCVKDRPHSAEVPRRHPRCPSPQLALSQLEPQGHSDWSTCHPAFCHCSYRI